MPGSEMNFWMEKLSTVYVKAKYLPGNLDNNTL
jgi:hypothetical protein